MSAVELEKLKINAQPWIHFTIFHFPPKKLRLQSYELLARNKTYKAQQYLHLRHMHKDQPIGLFLLQTILQDSPLIYIRAIVVLDTVDA